VRRRSDALTPCAPGGAVSLRGSHGFVSPGAGPERPRDAAEEPCEPLRSTRILPSLVLAGGASGRVRRSESTTPSKRAQRVAAVHADGSLASEVISTATGRAFGPPDLQQALVDLQARLRSTLNGKRAEALGFGTAGVVVEGRPLTQSENLPLLNGTDVASLV